MNLFRKCTAEFLGAFVIVLCGCGAIAINHFSGSAIGHVGTSIVWGLVVTVMIYAVGHISGAHFNPAVTLAFAVTRHFPPRQIAPYLIAQCLGAIAASCVHRFTLGPVLEHLIIAGRQPATAVLDLGVTQPLDSAFFTAFIWEMILTAILMFVIMSVATDFREVGHVAGLAIGGTVLVEAMFAGPLCNASMNPARSLGPAVVSGNWTAFGAYVAGPIVGAMIGAMLYEFVRCPPAPETGGGVKGCC